jgi:cytochrome c556
MLLASGLQAEDKDDKKDEKPKSIKAFMKKAHAGDEALKTAVTKAAKEKEYDKAATAQCAADVKALAKAVDDKDDKAISAALKTINTSCGTCHKAHKGK